MTTALHLHCATGFYARLMGVWHQPLHDGVGLWLRPCRTIHTLMLPAPLDILFLDRAHRIVRVVPALPPNRLTACWQAASVVELPGGWCQRHADYVQAIIRAINHSLTA